MALKTKKTIALILWWVGTPLLAVAAFNLLGDGSLVVGLVSIGLGGSLLGLSDWVRTGPNRKKTRRRLPR